MKIMQVNPTMNMGGIETFIMNVYRNIDKKLYDFIFLTYDNSHLDYEDEIISLGGKIIKISRSETVSKARHIFELYSVIKKEKPDVVHCHTYFDSAYVMLISKILGINVRISHSHTSESLLEKRLLKNIKRFIARRMINLFSTHKLACSTEAGIALFGSSNFTIIQNGIDLKKFFYSEDLRKEYRKEFELRDNDLVIGHVGRLDFPKNHEFLIKVFHEIKKTKKNSKLILVGSGSLENELKQQIAKLNLSDSVLFLGNRNDVNLLLNTMDVFVFPSVYEGLPISLIEAQANGLPIIVSNGVSKEVKLTNILQFYSLDKSAKEWAKHIIEIDKKHIDTKDILIQSEYSIEKTVEKLIKIYNKK